MSKTLLIIDDSIVMRMMLTNILKEAGYDVIAAENGQIGFEKAMEFQVKLIICDVNMPVMDGHTFIRLIKEQPEYHFVPIIMLTTMTKKLELDSEIKVWMVKPFAKDELLDAVRKLIG